MEKTPKHFYMNVFYVMNESRKNWKKEIYVMEIYSQRNNIYFQK